MIHGKGGGGGGITKSFIKNQFAFYSTSITRSDHSSETGREILSAGHHQNHQTHQTRPDTILTLSWRIWQLSYDLVKYLYLYWATTKWTNKISVKEFTVFRSSVLKHENESTFPSFQLYQPTLLTLIVRLSEIGWQKRHSVAI